MLADYLATHELAAEWREQIHVSHRFNFERDVMALLPSVSNQWEELAPIARAPFSKCWFEHAASDHPGLTERWEVPEQHPFKEYGPPDDRVGLLIEEIAPFTIAFTTFFSWRSGAFARIPLETRNVNEDPEKHSHWSVVAFASFMLLNTKNSVETVAITHNNKKRARHGKADIDQCCSSTSKTQARRLGNCRIRYVRCAVGLLHPIIRLIGGYVRRGCDVTGEPRRSHSASFDHRRRPETLRTAIAMPFFCPTSTTSRLPLVTPV
jgi:hypothetical protein